MNIRTILLITASVLFGLGNASAATSSGAKIYHKECSACHIAYPTQFLSTDSWNAVMANLADHFGDNAELAPEDLAAVKTFLQHNNYDQSRIKSRYGNRFDNNGTPKRLTETRLFRAMHNEVSDRYVSQNPKVKTFARCDACHRGAQNGNFDEDEVRIPR
jgi:cytochrome c2